MIQSHRFLSLFVFSLLIVFGNSAKAERVSLAVAGVSFEAPPGFTTLSSKEIAWKFPSNRAPRLVVGNKLRSTTIAVDLKPDPLSPEMLQEAMTAFVPKFERIIPGLEWFEKKMIDKSGQKWVVFEFSSHAVDTDIHNIMLFTSRKGKTLLFNFNSTKEDFTRDEAALRKSIDSIELTPGS